jgi:hypothetical protein
MDNVLIFVKKVVNFIRSRGLNQRQFTFFLKESESQYSSLSYYSEIRWLSSSKVLKQFWDLKAELCSFLEIKNQDTSLFADLTWLQDLSFMVDITKHLSDLNLFLQGKNQSITNMFDSIKAFICKLLLWERNLNQEDLAHFPTCNNFKFTLDKFMSFKKYAEKIIVACWARPRAEFAPIKRNFLKILAPVF